MNNINVTVELCAADRERLDKLTAVLEARINQEAYKLDHPAENAPDDIKAMLKNVLNKGEEPTPAEAPKTAPDAPKASDHPTLDPFPEVPTAKAEASEEQVIEVTSAELQQLAIELCRQKKQPDIKKVLGEYGIATVSEVLSKLPKDKHGEVFKKLKALEG